MKGKFNIFSSLKSPACTLKIKAMAHCVVRVFNEDICAQQRNTPPSGDNKVKQWQL